MNNAYFPHTDKDRQEMLFACGVTSFDELIQKVPDHLKLKHRLNLPTGASEEELRRQLAPILHVSPALQFTGLGRYDHIRPAVIDHLAGRSEFYTAYTPYQAELSQGTLQCMLEYQTMMCELTAMDVSNAGLYDGATAACEAIQMALNIKKEKLVYIDPGILPYTREIIECWYRYKGIEFVDLPDNSDELKPAAATFIRYPDALGKVRDLSTIHYSGLLIFECDPVALGILTPPGELKADICCGDNSSLGLYMQMGGPSAGFLCCKKEYTRYLPGRIAGIAHAENGQEGVVLTLQAREQHIRREKARSNVCTNQMLMTIQAAMYMASLGPVGLSEVAEQSYKKAHYLARQLEKLPHMLIVAPNISKNEDFFNEFILELPERADHVVQQLLKDNIVPGIPVSRYFEGGSENQLLIAVTEKHSRPDLILLVKKIADFLTHKKGGSG